jgi:Fur family ferric uptake transcriptional regulator
METRVERLCVEHGLKMTGQRRVIARVLSDAEDHPDVEELYRRASALDNRISIATVYRTVRLLEEKGILERRDFGGGRARYEPTEHGRHYHLIDIASGRVIEFEDAEHDRLMQAIAARLGFRLLSTRLELFGARLDANDAAAPIPAQAPAQAPPHAPAQAPAAARARPQASEAVGRPAARAAPNGRAQR